MVKTRSRKWLKPVIYIAVGLAAGLAYSYFIDGGSRPYVAAIFGTVSGVVLFGLSKSGPCCACKTSGSTCGFYNYR